MQIKHIILIIIPVIFMNGCSMFPGKTKRVTGPEKEQVLAYASPAIDLLFSGFQKGDYSDYSKHFDEVLKNQLTRSVFKQTRSLIISKIGNYRSHEIIKILRQDQYKYVLCRMIFDEEDAVSLKVSFQRYPEGQLISGLWISAPGLRK